MSSAEWMDMMGKTLATIGAAWLCVLLALVLFDYMQNAKLKLGLTQATSFG